MAINNFHLIFKMIAAFFFAGRRSLPGCRLSEGIPSGYFFCISFCKKMWSESLKKPPLVRVIEMLLICLLFCLQTSCQRPPAWQQPLLLSSALKQAKAALIAHQWPAADEALATVRRSVADYKHNPIYWTYLAQLQHGQGDDAQAAAAAFTAWQLAPSSRLAMSNYAVWSCAALAHAKNKQQMQRFLPGAQRGQKLIEHLLLTVSSARSVSAVSSQRRGVIIRHDTDDQQRRLLLRNLHYCMHVQVDMARLFA